MATKIEKTLELNITHELLSLADSFWWYLQPISLKRFWRPHWRFPIIQGPNSFATGLHINLEGKANGGYDICINSPSNFQGGNPRLLFMQFKAGIEQPFNTDNKSCFFGDASKPNKHVEFDINSNKKRNQHKLLQDLAVKAGNVVIDDGHPHKFRTCYIDYNKSEVNRFFFFFGKENRPGGYIGEIFAIRMYRALKSLQNVQDPEFPPYRYNLMDALIRHIINIANHFEVSREKFYSKLMEFPDIMKRMGYHDLDNSLLIKEENPNVKIGNEIFSDIVQALSRYLKWISEEEYFDKRMKIPEPRSEFTILIPPTGIRFDVGEISIDEEDASEITYQLL